jgi:hypothetical protein
MKTLRGSRAAFSPNLYFLAFLAALAVQLLLLLFLAAWRFKTTVNRDS